MSNASQSIAGLSPQEKRELLKQLLQEKASKANTVSPLSYGQRALWFLYQLAPESAAYHVALAARIRSKVNVPALQRAFQALVARHASLRTTFTVWASEPVQEFHGQHEITIEQIDVSGCDEEMLKEQVAAHHHRPFNLESGPVARLALFTRSEADHVLLMTVHHIAIDGWSIGLLLNEVYALYLTEMTGAPPSLPPASTQYADFVHWQTEMLAGPEGERLRGYWLKQLSGELPALNLPTDRPRPPVQTHQGASCDLNLSESLVQQLRALAKAERTTLYTVILSAFQTLLHRYTGQDDILVGSPTVGRSRREFQKVVGYFVNPVVMRANLTGNPTFRAFLGQMRQTVLEALSHQDYPFPLLVEQLHLKRDPSRSPVIEVMFNLQKVTRLGMAAGLLTPDGKGSSVMMGDLELAPFNMHQEEGQFDLGLDMLQTYSALLGVIKYNTDLFDAPTIGRLAGHFQTLLEGIAANPDQRLSELPLLTEAERRQLLVEWNDTQADYPTDVCLHQLFETQVERTPDSVAVVFEDRSLIYRELNRRANQLARHLQSLGVGPDSLVGICVERSLEMVVGLLGVLKAGGAYVPLDPEYPLERLALMIADAGMPVLLTQAALLDKLPSRAARAVCLDQDWQTIAAENDTNLPAQVTADNLAYVIYTSGSTGRPKGALIPHSAICNHMFWMQRVFPLTEQDSVLQKTPFSFDASVWEFYAPLFAGGRLIMARPGGHLDGAYLAETIAAQKVTTLQLVPSLLRMLLNEPQLAECASLKRVFCGGEALTVDLRDGLFSILPEATLHNLYGPTEAAIDSTFWTCQHGDERRSIPIGRPIGNAQAYIVDAHLNPVPAGVPGELLIGGAGLARGYHNRPELTAEKFIPSPFNSQANARLYKTGDLARYLPDGNIEYLGRIDYQVKLRGFRIELGEIESALAQHPAIKEKVVIVREDSPGDKRLVAYLVPAPERTPAARELRRYLREQLPDYMAPSTFVTLAALPLTPNGKVDRKALPAPERQRPAASATAPLTPTESLLVKIWQEALGVEQVGVYDNFFDLGGHSLLSVEVLTKLEKETGIKLNPNYIRVQTLGQLAAMYDEQKR